MHIDIGLGDNKQSIEVEQKQITKNKKSHRDENNFSYNFKITMEKFSCDNMNS